jgi:hypothetical protein
MITSLINLNCANDTLVHHANKPMDSTMHASIDIITQHADQPFSSSDSSLAARAPACMHTAATVIESE